VILIFVVFSQVAGTTGPHQRTQSFIYMGLTNICQGWPQTTTPLISMSHLKLRMHTYICIYIANIHIIYIFIDTHIYLCIYMCIHICVNVYVCTFFLVTKYCENKNIISLNLYSQTLLSVMSNSTPFMSWVNGIRR
jgi:hypothetical protein